MIAPAHDRPVVVGVDASEAALRAVAFAADEARRRGAPLRLVHAMDWPLDGVTMPPPEMDVAGMVRSAAHEVLRTAITSATATTGTEVTATVADGDPVDVLRRASATAQLVVVGSRGAGGVAGLLTGSTATALVGHADCPVVVLPDPTSARVSPRRSVVVGVEGRRGDQEVLDFAFEEASARGTDVVAVHAWQDVVLGTAHRSMSPLVDSTGVAAEEERALAEALAGWRDKEPDVPVQEVVVRDRAARALVTASMTAELVVVGHRRRHALGSTTHGVLHRATCPVAVVPVLDGGSR